MFRDVLRSRAGREIFALSSLIAAVPILLVGTIALLEVNRNFAGRTREHLTETARSYGEVVYERLLLASELVYQTAVTNGSVADHPSEQIESVELVDRTGTADIRRRTMWIDVSTVPAKVYVLRRVGERTAVGRVSPDYLWGDFSDFPYSIEFCVLASGSGRPVFCPGGMPGTVQQAIGTAPSVSGHVQWDSTEARMSSAYWELFTHSVFDGPLLRFVATQPEAIALGPWNAFRAFYAPAIALAIGLMLLAASIHVRRTLRPIHALVDATRRIASGDFTARAEIRRKDEFGELAHAMNRMADGLMRQIDTMRMLAQIDRLILTGAGIDLVAKRVLEHLAGILPVPALAILLPDQNSPEAAQVHTLQAAGSEVQSARLTLAAGVLPGLAAHRRGLVVDNPASVPWCNPVVCKGVARVLVNPLMARERVVGAVLIGIDSAAGLDEAQMDSVRDFAARLAVALEAAERETELLRRAYFDELTRLPNRQLLLDRLAQALIHADKASERLLVLFVDLDRFKTVNDSFGHSAGDGLLREAATRLCAAVGDTVTVARLGGDEFVAVLPRPAADEDGQVAVIDRVLTAMSQPFRIGTSEVFLSTSIGVAAFPEDGETADELLRKADTAMYGAKDAGRNQAFFYSADMSRVMRHKLDTEAQLRHALEREEFRIAFQPQFCLRSNRVVAAEALLRWHNPRRGTVSPQEFIPIAEETGYITILGAWAMYQACAQVGRWRRSGSILEQIAVNVSVRQFRQRDFARQVEECLARNGLPPQTLLLELTESLFVHDLPSARRTIDELKEIGVSIAIDDFGTGYSSLGYLKQLSFDQVKIDRAFVKDLPDDQAGMAIVNAVVAMSHTLGKPVIAEGIENTRQLEYLRKVGVDLGQGFLLGRPVYAESFPLPDAAAAGSGNLRTTG